MKLLLCQHDLSEMVFVFLFCVSMIGDSMGFVPDLYCGKRDCYEVLGVTRDSTKQEIAKLYRKLAAKHHPDKAKGDKAKKEAEEQFRLIATAYETLKDDETRKDYDYMLDNPDEYLRHYYFYYRRRVAPQVDVRLVIAVTIICISLFQYLSAYHKYSEAIKYFSVQTKYRLQAVEIAKERGLIEPDQRKGKKRREKEELKEEEEEIIRSIIAEKMDIKGGHKKPSVFDVLLFQLVYLPVALIRYLMWYFRWLFKFTICREDFGDEEKLYLIRKHLGITENHFAILDEKDVDEFLEKELWIKSKFVAWKTQREEEEKRKMAESAKYKKYRRFMKNQGPGQMTFLDE